MTEPNKYRDRKFLAVLYPEDPTHVQAIEKLNAGGYNFAAILHHSDTWEEGEKEGKEAGELKKAHWHIVLRFKNAVWNTAVAKDLGITPNYLEPCKDVDGSLLYLVHAASPKKFQYDQEEVFGPLKLKLATLLADTDEGTRVLGILDIINNHPGHIGYSDCLKKVVDAGLYSDFRRMGAFATALIREHNYSSWGISERYLCDSYQRNSGVAKDFENLRDYLEFTGDKGIGNLPGIND